MVSVRVLLVDDDRLFLEGLARLVGVNAEFAVVGVARTAARAITVARRARPDVAVIDFKLADCDGVALTEELQQSLPGMRCIILTGYPHEAHAALALSNARNCSVHSKTSDADTILALLSNGTPAMAGVGHHQTSDPSKPVRPTLTPTMPSRGRLGVRCGGGRGWTRR